jgi:hypothetical protein
MKHYPVEREWKAEKLDKGDVFLDYDDELEVWILIGSKSNFCYDVFGKDEKSEAIRIMNKRIKRYRRR